MKARTNQKSKGFALALALILSLILIMLSVAITYITQVGFIGISVHQKNKIVENDAEWGISQAILGLEVGNVTCNETLNLTSPNGGSVEVRLVKAGDTCFIWSKATFKTMKLVKVATVTISSTTDYAPLIANNFYFYSMCCMAPYISIESCDPSCPTPAAILGNSLSSEFLNDLHVCGGIYNYGFISNATPIVKENA
ncbi:MAG: hypothetical protein GXO57_08620, partial [Thermodesulfobacteria bacterium]|nr:hypothetical protein [Thermodesulfobacteriota bacterium]